MLRQLDLSRWPRRIAAYLLRRPPFETQDKLFNRLQVNKQHCVGIGTSYTHSPAKPPNKNLSHQKATVHAAFLRNPL